ncbi:MAG: hypothetical protein HY579_10150 [Nitrospinae bacterium]|nr:hypothetical protein [Nitrospinota bacterium]
MKLKTGDSLFEPLSGNTGEVMNIVESPEGKLVTIRWRVEDHLHHDTEHFYSKVLKSIKRGEIQLTPK